MRKVTKCWFLDVGDSNQSVVMMQSVTKNKELCINSQVSISILRNIKIKFITITLFYELISLKKLNNELTFNCTFDVRKDLSPVPSALSFF